MRHYFENHGSVAECKILEEEKNRQFGMKIKETDILIDKPKCEKPKTVRAPENIAAVTESVRKAPSITIHHRSEQLNISDT